MGGLPACRTESWAEAGERKLAAEIFKHLQYSWMKWSCVKYFSKMYECDDSSVWVLYNAHV